MMTFALEQFTHLSAHYSSLLPPSRCFISPLFSTLAYFRTFISCRSRNLFTIFRRKPSLSTCGAIAEWPRYGYSQLSCQPTCLLLHFLGTSSVCGTLSIVILWGTRFTAGSWRDVGLVLWLLGLLSMRLCLAGERMA